MDKSKLFSRMLWCVPILFFSAATYPQTKVEKSSQKPKEVMVVQSAGAMVYQQNIQSVVLIDVEEGGGRTQGSGVAFLNGFSKNAVGKMVPSSTWIVTNAHVVKNAKTVSVLVDGFQVRSDVWFRDKDMDIAFLSLNDTVLKPASNTQKIVAPNTGSAQKTATLAAGDTVFAIGAPRGLTGSITEGLVSAIRTINGIRLIQTSAAISPGSSGGGLFTSTGDLAGITTFKLVNGESLNFAVEISQVLNLYEASWDAKMISSSVDSKYWPTFDDAFTTWLFTSRGETGGTVHEEYKDAKDRLEKNKISKEKFDEKEFDIANRYYKLVSAKTSSNSVGANRGNGSGSKLVLICQLFGTTGGAPRTESYEIDFSKGTIEGHPARINSSFMEFSYKNKSGVEYTGVFDRHASTLSVSTERFPRLLHGRCSKSEGRAF